MSEVLNTAEIGTLILVLGKYIKKDQKFIVFLGYIASLKPVWATWGSILK